MAGQTNKFGHPMWYASKSGGFNYEMEDDPEDSKFCDFADEFSFDGHGTVTMKPNGPTDFGIGKNIAGFDDAIGGNSMSFPDTAARGYMYKKDDARDIEFKTVMEVSGLGDHGVSISVCTGHHGDPKPNCQGCAYMCTVEVGKNPSTFTFRKEEWHVHYTDSPEGEWTHSKCNFKIDGHGKVGYGFVRYNKPTSGGNSPEDDNVVLQVWFNPHPDSDPLDWTMLKEITDTKSKKWGDDGDNSKCKGDNKNQVLVWSGPQNRLKTNATNGQIKFSKVSLREIDPSGVVGPGGGDPGGGDPGGGGPPVEPPPSPTTGTIFRDWAIKYNLITFPEDACQGGVDTSKLLPFYDVEDNGSSSNLHRDRYRVCMIANGSASKFIGKKPRSVKMWLSSATSATPDGDISVVMHKNNTDESVVTFTLTHIDGVPATPPLNANTLTPTKHEYTFQNLTSEYIWQVGDRLCVEYSGNSVDTINEVNVWRNTDNAYDGTNSCAIKFDAGGPPPTGYTPPDVSRDYAWEISELSASTSTTTPPDESPGPTPAPTLTYVFDSKFGSHGSGNGQFLNPHDITFDSSGNIFVTDRDRNDIQKFSPTGTYISKFGSSGSGNGQFNVPYSAAHDSSGNIYVADRENNRIQKLNGSGTYISKITSAGGKNFNSPEDITFDAAGDIYICDTGNNRIVKFTSGHSFIRQWGKKGSGKGEFDHPHSIDVGIDGNIYISSGNQAYIQVFTKDGVYIRKFSQAGRSDGDLLTFLEHLDIDKFGRLHIINNNDRPIVSVFDCATGNFLSKYGSPEKEGSADGQFREPEHVTCDANGRPHVVDCKNFRIQIFTFGET